MPSTSTLLDLAGVTLAPVQQGQTSNVRNSNKRFDIVPLDNSTRRSGPASARGPPDEEGLARLAKEARACAEVNYVGTVLALGCFVSLPNQEHGTRHLAGEQYTPNRIKKAGSRRLDLLHCRRYSTVLTTRFRCWHPPPSRLHCTTYPRWPLPFPRLVGPYTLLRKRRD